MRRKADIRALTGLCAVSFVHAICLVTAASKSAHFAGFGGCGTTRSGHGAACWLASGYMSGALGLLSHWFDSGDVRCARAAARVRATRFQPERVGPTPRLLWASPCGRALAGRWRTIPAAARGCPGRSWAGGGASRRSNRSPEPLSFAASRNPNDAAPSPMVAPMYVLRAVPGILHAGARARW